jgi:alginate O-acetyltransferase complex protein AlgJ
MNSPTIQTRIQAIAERTLIVVFVAFVSLPTLGSLFHFDHTPPQQENRNLARLPAFRGLAELRPFVAGLEQFFNDHFGFRQWLLRCNNDWKFKVFHEFSNGSILLGREGWIYWTRDGGLDDYCGTSRFNQQQLREWATILEARKDRLAKSGTKYIFVIPPNKQSIYPEYIPAWVRKGDSPSKLDQFVTYMKAHTSVEVLDLRPSLIAAKNTGFLFLKTDTHWNALGAFIGCQQLALALSRQFPEIRPLQLDTFDRKAVIAPAGDLAKYIGQANELQEPQQWAFSPCRPLKPLQQFVDSQFPDTEWLKPDRISENEDNTGEAIVFHDSFAEEWMPFLGYHFKKVIYVPWQWQSHNWDSDLLEGEKPQVVIDEMVERFVITADPAKLMPRHVPNNAQRNQ